MESPSHTGEEGEPHDERHGGSLIEIDAPSLANVIRDQKALPLTDDDREKRARALETSDGDEQFLVNTLSTIRFLIAELESSTPRSAERPHPPAA
jgi:hypothetical protein